MEALYHKIVIEGIPFVNDQKTNLQSRVKWPCNDARVEQSHTEWIQSFKGIKEHGKLFWKYTYTLDWLRWSSKKEKIMYPWRRWWNIPSLTGLLVGQYLLCRWFHHLNIWFNVQQHYCSQSILIRVLLWHLFKLFQNYKDIIGHPEGLMRSPSIFFFFFLAVGVTGWKNFDMPASRWACCHQVTV